MNNTLTIVRKELKTYFNSPIAYITLVLFVSFVSWWFFRPFFIVGQASLRTFFSILPWVFLIFMPAITMRLWAEEKKLTTLELLLTLPVRDHEVVLGKYLAAVGLLAVMLGLTVTIPIATAWLGDPDPGPVIGGYVGALMMGAAFLSIGTFVSSLTENQIVALIVGVMINFGLLVIGEEFVLTALPRWIRGFAQSISMGAHFESIQRGVIDSRDILYYLSVIGLFLFLNVRSVESRKWR